MLFEPLALVDASLNVIQAFYHCNIHLIMHFKPINLFNIHLLTLFEPLALVDPSLNIIQAIYHCNIHLLMLFEPFIIATSIS